MTVRKKHKQLKKLVNIAEKLRSIRRGPSSWYNLRMLKKEKLSVKDDFIKVK